LGSAGWGYFRKSEFYELKSQIVDAIKIDLNGVQLPRKAMLHTVTRIYPVIREQVF
jgi:hypothetical protein